MQLEILHNVAPGRGRLTRGPLSFLGLFCLILLGSLAALNAAVALSLVGCVVIGAYLVVLYRRPVVALFCYCVFNLFEDTIVLLLGDVPGIALVRDFGHLIALLSFLMMLARGRLRRTSADGWLFAFLCVALVSNVVHHVPLGLSILAFFLLIKPFLVFYMFAALDFADADLRMLYRLFFKLTLVFMLVSLVELAAPDQLHALLGQPPVDFRYGLPSLQSLFVHPGIFAWYASLVASFSMALFFVYRRSRYLGFALLGSISAILTLRRKPLGGLSVSFFTGLSRINGRSKFTLFFLVGTLMGTIVLLFHNTLANMVAGLLSAYVFVDDPMKVARLALYLVGNQIASANFPLGAGVGRFGSWMSFVYYSPLYDQYGLSSVWGLQQGATDTFGADTFWPMILGETGYLGLVFYLGLLFSLFNNAWRLSRACSHLIRAFALGAVMALVEAFIESSAQPIFVAPLTSTIIFAVLGICYSLGKRSVEA